MRERERITHPSYGMISFSRVQGNPPYFFGSELPQDHYISLTVATGEMDRDLSRDWFYAKETILQLRMTSNQFSELITSMNNGSGVPCTLEYIPGVKVPQEENKAETKKEYTHRAFTQRMVEFSGKFRGFQDTVKQITNKQVISKKDKEELNKVVSSLFTELTSNIPFFLECFQEHMDKVVLEAKGEVEAAIMHKITTLGLEQLHEQQKKISL